MTDAWAKKQPYTWLRPWVGCMVYCLWMTGSLPVEAAGVGPLHLSGSIGYSLRDLSTQKGRDTTSNQLRGTLNANTYLWQPWFAVGSLRLTGVRDSSTVEGSQSTQSDLFTGNAVLNGLPQSHTPFHLSYRVSDTRIDRISLQQVPVSFAASSSFNTNRLVLKQSFLTEGGHRFQLRYDDTQWKSFDGGTFDDTALGAEADLRLVKNRIVGRVSNTNTKNSFKDENEDRFVLNVEHDYVPNAEWRVDSLFNILNEDRTSVGSFVRTSSTLDSHQLSSFVFWRPDTQPFTVSGGIRVHGIDTRSGDFSSSQETYSGSLGGFYQYTKNLRFDGNLSASQIDTGTTTINRSQQRIGALYQSDVYFLQAWTYQWYGTGAVSNQTSNREENIAILSASLGHNLNRNWQQTEFSFLRLGLSQLLSGAQDTGNLDNAQLLSHSGSLTWNAVHGGGGNSVAQLSLSDSRDLSATSENQQLFNFQFTRNQPLSRLSGVSGSLTLQHLRQNHAVIPDSTDTSASGRVNYHHQRLLGVDRLQFLSDLYLSKAELSDSFDRFEWENRLTYNVGQTESLASLKWIDSGSLTYYVVYLTITRHF
ncbi:MAG: hypothetical protein D6698_07040 [Gammaproteobacteria bacterium]|nr:MAG: hypothetical protein D6698_07040 [Gammaproteobacteria bacterium]